LASAAGLSARLVTTEGYETFGYPAHSFNEVFLPEYRTWIYTDLTFGIVYLKAAGKPFNIVQTNRLLRLGIKQMDVEAMVVRDKTERTNIDKLPIRFKEYFAAPQRFRFYYPHYLNEQKQLSFFDRIRRFTKPSYNFAYYSEDNHYGSSGFLLRAISGYLAILSVVLTVIVTGLVLWKQERGTIAATKN
jgi:hypothetical protein